MLAANMNGKFEGSELRTLLEHDHDRLEGMYERLLAAVRADAKEEVIRLWSQFEVRLLRHMDVEEELILPALSDQDPAEVEALLAEHVTIRRGLAELGVAIDLHSTRAEVVEQFLALLRRHAAREDALAYRWAEANLSAETTGEVHARLVNRPRRLRS